MFEMGVPIPIKIFFVGEDNIFHTQGKSMANKSILKGKNERGTKIYKD